MSTARQQLTLFLKSQGKAIEEIRMKFNPVQYDLIPAHVTLCREDEIENIKTVLENIRSLTLDKPVRLDFLPPARFENGKGVLIPAKEENAAFDDLRKMILKGITDAPRKHHAHITLMHPRNSTCTDEIFEQIKEINVSSLFFDTISLIEQHNGEKWTVVEHFPMVYRT